jgi:hypothetical protein
LCALPFSSFPNLTPCEKSWCFSLVSFFSFLFYFSFFAPKSLKNHLKITKYLFLIFQSQAGPGTHNCITFSCSGGLEISRAFPNKFTHLKWNIIIVSVGLFHFSCVFFCTWMDVLFFLH